MSFPRFLYVLIALAIVAIIGEASGQSTGFINDIHGHVVARVSGGSIEWNAARAIGYGHAPGATTPPLGSGHPLAHSFGWRGKYRDGTGLYCLHLRYYNPTTGRFESPDPLGHAACPDLYSAFNGDPTNYFDPDGRYFRTALTGNSNGSWASTLASTTSQYHPVYGLSSSILGTARNYSANLALHDGRNLGALDATLNPANRGGSGFVEAYQGIGISGHNVGQSLNNFERAQSAVHGASGLLDTVGLGFGGAGLLRGVSAVAGPSKIFSPSVVEPTSVPTVSPSTAAGAIPDPYTGIRQASQYLQEMGVSRADRVRYLQSFEPQNMVVRQAGQSEFGLRFFSDPARAGGQYLFETFPASRASLAIKPEWSTMAGFRQFQIRPGATLLEGRAAAQGPYLPGGQTQKFILDSRADLIAP